MRIALFGITGNAGRRIASEALDRGHFVVGVVRDTTKGSTEHPNLTMFAGNVLDPASVAEAVKDCDAALSAVGPGNFEHTTFLADAAKALIAGLVQADVKRLLFLGGAGTLEVAPGVQLVDSPGFPDAWKGIALAHRDAWEIFKAGPDLDWTYIAPAAMLEPGPRTGHYRTGTNNLVVNEKGESRISMEDYAVAMIDELEHPKHLRQRMSVGY
jgi:putative NADH-flavin reductase